MIKRRGKTNVLELRPGDVWLTVDRDHAQPALRSLVHVFVGQKQHPVWPALQLVIWRVSNGETRLEALDCGREYEEIHRPQTEAEAKDILLLALGGTEGFDIGTLGQAKKKGHKL